MKYLLLLFTLSFFIFDFTAAQGGRETGTVVFTASGEDLVRSGFTEKEGWDLRFDHLYVNIADPEAFDPSQGKKVKLSGDYWIDLADGDANPIAFGIVEGVDAGNYQALKFSLQRAETGDYAGYSIVMIGNAVKSETMVPFLIRLNEEMEFFGSEGYVGEELKGLLLPGKETSVEMTFHFDHIFGHKDAAGEDHINSSSVGFDFFYTESTGKVDISQNDLLDKKNYREFLFALWNLGHLGEGHCDVSNQSSWNWIENDG